MSDRRRSDGFGHLVWFECDTVEACAWWRHQMETFSALLAICTVNSSIPGEFPTQRPVTRSFDVYFDLRPNKRLSKQSWGWWFETPSRPLWRHRNGKMLRFRWFSVSIVTDRYSRPEGTNVGPTSAWQLNVGLALESDPVEQVVIAGRRWFWISLLPVC